MTQEKPSFFYQTELQKVGELIVKFKQTSNKWLAAKIVIFLTGVAIIWLAIRESRPEYYWGIALTLIIYLVASKLDAINLNRIEAAERLQQTLKNELNALNGDFSAFRDGKEYVNPSHEYTYDLDIFGGASLFQRINRTITKEGSDRLAALFGNYPTDETLIGRRNVAIRELASNGQELMHFIASPHQEEDRLRKYIEILRQREDLPAAGMKFFNTTIIVACGCLLLTWGTLAAAISGVVSWYLFGLFFFFQLITGFLLSKRSGKMIGETEGLHKSMSAYIRILRFVTEKQFKSPYLRAFSEELSGADRLFKRLSHIIQAIYCRINDVMFILLNGMVLFDVFLLRAYDCWKGTAVRRMNHWLDLLADTDALISMAVYTFNHPENKDASFLDASSPYIVRAKGLYHPFLSQGTAVGNDLELQSTEMMIVTGANMAGKSTFLRTVGINYVMAMNGIPVCAESLSIKKVALFSSMRTADNLASHISYFHAELLRLEQLVEFCKHQTHTLIILDEILKGTNSEDKLKGSILFLKKILSLPVTGIVATHDLKLSDLEQEDAHFQNFCFEIGLGKELSYSYKIKKGVARNLNATYLLNEILEKITSH